jgi:hypothetical protein
MTSMTSPQRSERRDIRYPLNLPVSIRLARKEMRARSENISLGGILLSSAFLIPEGSTVEVNVGVANLADPGTLLSSRGKVVRVQPKTTGDFAVAIQLECPFKVPLQGLNSRSSQKASPFHQRKNSSQHFALAWHTET